MSAPCVWSEETLANRYPRYRDFFAKRGRSRSVRSTPTPQSDTQEEDKQVSASTAKVPDGSSAEMSLPLRNRGRSSPPPPLPAAPQPSADEAIHEVNAQVFQQQEEQGVDTVKVDVDEAVDVLTLRPVQALELLCAYVQSLVEEPSQKPPKPPTPPSSGNSSNDASPAVTPAAVDENRRSLASESGLAPPSEPVVSPGPISPQHPFLQRVPRASRTPIDSPISHPQSPIPSTHPTSPVPLDKRTHIVAQSDKLARKFYCKSAPPVTLRDYLARLHKFCPMSVACYLAAGVYIERLTRRRGAKNRRGSFLPLTPVTSNSSKDASNTDENSVDQVKDVDEAPLVEVTSKSVHRLLLAALRVANKALEDGVFPHRRMSMVGGVSEMELARLEVSMCFLADFELVITLRDMQRWVGRTKARISRKLSSVGSTGGKGS